jgi:glyoxylase-like metal-dependent hydrolase (beta-lactamase superfamily II)/8-oxo-dGTP pyrophosphatase MutT (NUDIX family)
MASAPKDAAAIIMLKDPLDPKLFWVKRDPGLAFMGGYHAFPGGQTDKTDASIRIVGCGPGDESVMRACAIRELFEETGVLLARGADRLSPSQLSERRGALAIGEKSFQQVIEDDDLALDASPLIPAGRWVTPPFSPRRFDTWFFLAWLPEPQETTIEPGELESGEWIRPGEALDRWKRGELIMAPPVLHAIRTLANILQPSTPDVPLDAERINHLASSLSAIPEANRSEVRRIEFGPGIFFFPVRTPTLPPATHTNCYIIGASEVIIIDPASPYEEEQRALDSFLAGFLEEGRTVREILLTHHHPDHVAGANHLAGRLGVQIAAHRLTAQRLAGAVRVDRFVEDDEIIDLPGDPGWRLRALHTPGHTRGHLCFYEENTGAIITGDLVVGIGTVIIDPPEGNMLQYLHSLGRLLQLPRLMSLYPAHGPAISSARLKIEEYISHRNMREGRILEAMGAGAETAAGIVPLAYPEIDSSLYGLAERSTLAHLEKLVEEGKVTHLNDGRYQLS